MKATYKGVTFEGTPEEIKEVFKATTRQFKRASSENAAQSVKDAIYMPSVETQARPKKRGRKPKKHYRQWKPADIHYLQEAVQAGFSVKKIKTRMGRTASSVYNMISKLKIKGAL